MSWDDYYRRRDLLNTVLSRAASDPSAALPFSEVEGAVEEFGDERQLLLALYYRWNQLLAGNLRNAVCGPEDTDVEPESEATDAVTAAWRKTVSEQPVLRAVLDANIDRYPSTLVPSLESEQRLLALSARLVEPYESSHEITKVGASFMALIRHDLSTKGRSHRPARHLLRLFSNAS